MSALSTSRAPDGVSAGTRGLVNRPGQTALDAHLEGLLETGTGSVRVRRGARLPSELLQQVLKFLDFLVITAVFLTHIALSGIWLPDMTLAATLPYIALGVTAVWGLSLSEAWTIDRRTSAEGRALRVLNRTGALLSIATMLVLLAWPQTAIDVAMPVALWLWITLGLLHLGFSLVLDRIFADGRMAENVVIVGATPRARKLIANNLVTREMNIVGIFDDRLARAPNQIGGVPVLGTLQDMLSWPELPNTDAIIVTVTSEARERVRSLIDQLRGLPQTVVLLLDLAGFDPETESVGSIGDAPAAYVSGAPKNIARIVVKRLTDLVIASLLLAGFAPVFLAIAIAIRLEGPGPIFFRQRRHGFNNQIIRVFKFRSMKPDTAAEHCMSEQTFEGDSRVTRVGRFIRRTSLDELPQLLNVLRGDMSLVGPRPHAVGMTTEQTEVHAIVGDYAHRHRVKPGLTGWAQVNGSRGPVHTKEAVRERVRLDLDYIDKSSFWFDLGILAMTAPCLLGDRKADR